MPSVEDWVNAPLEIIQRLFDSEREKYDQKVTEYFENKTKDKLSLQWIPSLNDVPLHNLRTNTLVRFRCMVQDMYDPEFFLGVYEVKDKSGGSSTLRSGKYKDLAECGPQHEIQMESPKNVTMDRQTLYCIPIPGEKDWVKSLYAKNSRVNVAASCSQSMRNKRSLDEEPPSSCAMDTCADGDNIKGKEDMDTDTTDPNGDVANPAKECKVPGNTTDGATTASKTPDLNFPLPGEKGPACIVKVYTDKAELKLNDMVEFIGILSNDPAMVCFQENESEQQSSFLDAQTMDDFDNDCRSPPPSLVPRLHSILIRKLAHNNPLLPDSIDAEDSRQEVEGFLNEVKSIREEIIAILEQAIFGDKLAAEYLLCHLVSNIYARQDVVALGKFALNLSGCPKDSKFPNLIYDLLKELVCKAHFLSMSLDNMNSLNFLPRKDYTANRLNTGILQLSERTHLVVDETALQPGQLDTKGVANITALGNMICWQKLDYDFNFHKQDFPTNIVSLVLSEGKSILKCDCQVPIVPLSAVTELEEIHSGIHTYLTPVLCTKLRMYIGLLQLLHYRLPEQVQKTVEQDFVEARKDDAKNMSVDDFHNLLVLARLLSLSYGQRSLSVDIWEKTKQMETLRKERLPQTDTAVSN